jgi:hypothetical protein
MSFEKTFIVTSLRHPDKVWTSADDFWADHEPEVNAADDANETYTESGKLLSQTSTLNVDGKSVTYTKVYASEEAWNEFNEGEQEAVTEESTVCTFSKVTIGSRIPEPA